MNSMRPAKGKLSSAGSTTCTTWPRAPLAESWPMMRRKSAIGLHKSDSSTTSENGAGAKFGGRLGRSAVSCMIASAIFSMTLRFAVGRINPGMPTRSPPCTSTSASANATTSARSSLLHSVMPEAEFHRRRTVGPEPDGVRGFPFALAHIEIIVARGATPIDIVGRLADHEPPVLPEILAGSGAAAAVQAMDHGGRDAARFQNEPRNTARRVCGFCRPPPEPRRFPYRCLGDRPFVYPMRAFSRSK